VAGGDEVSSGADDQDAVNLAANARKQRAGLGAQLRRPSAPPVSANVSMYREKRLTPGERQSVGRRAFQDFEAGAWFGAEQSRDQVASGMRKDVAA
jgi:hypothetical protein